MLGAAGGCRDDVRALPAASRPQQKLAEDAEKAVLRLSQGYAAIDQVDQALFKRAMELGRQYVTSNPQWAKKFLHVALLIQPENNLAKTLLKQLADLETPAVGGGVFESHLLDPKMPNWQHASDRIVEWKDGILALQGMGDSNSDFLLVRLSGKYAVRASMRMVEVGPRRACGVFLGRGAGKDTYAFILGRTGEAAIANMSKRGAMQLDSEILPDFVFTDWHQIEIQVDGANVTCLIDGKQVCQGAAPSPGDFEGNTGLFAQDCRLEVREFGVAR